MNFLALLGVLFIGLKLTHYIAWAWIWVLSPLWIPLAIQIAVVILTFGTASLALIITSITRYIRKW